MAASGLSGIIPSATNEARREGVMRKRKRVGRYVTPKPVAPPPGTKDVSVACETTVAGWTFEGGRCERFVLDRARPTDPRRPGAFVWLDIHGAQDVGLLQAIGRIFGLHPLAVEDAVHVHQRAKVESYAGHTFFVVRMAHFEGAVSLEQLALFIGQDFVVTVQEGADDGDPFGRLRRQLEDGSSRPPITTPDTLAYALVDAVVDDYFPVLDAFGETLEQLEDEIIAGKREVLPRIQRARLDVVALRKALWPLRDALFSVSREGLGFSQDTRLYLRDTTDHVLRVLDIAEGYREMVASLMELYLSTMSQKMNETMRFLAVISTIFIPLTFIAGVYGMNFDVGASGVNMPELRSPVGYPVVLGVMLAIGLGLLWYFKRRGWLGSD